MSTTSRVEILSVLIMGFCFVDPSVDHARLQPARTRIQSSKTVRLAMAPVSSVRRDLHEGIEPVLEQSMPARRSGIRSGGSSEESAAIELDTLDPSSLWYPRDGLGSRPSTITGGLSEGVRRDPLESDRRYVTTRGAPEHSRHVASSSPGLKIVERVGAEAGEDESGAFDVRMKAALQQYLDGFNRGDAESIASLFAEGATIEDPVGGGRIVQGKEAIAAFYRRAVERVERLELDAPIRGSHGRAAAMAFTIHMRTEGRIVRAIDVMHFDPSGKIVEMKAYHGPSDVFLE